MFGPEDEPDARFVELEDCKHIVEVGSLDHWMSLQTEKGQIKLKVCPLCKTPIRRNLRYGSIVNAVLNDIETVKARMFGDRVAIATKRRQVARSVFQQRSSIPNGVADDFKEQMESQLSLGELTCIENKLNILVAIEKAKKRAEDTDCRFEKEKKQMKQDLVQLQYWLLKPRMYLSDQELDDCSNEEHRLSLCLSLFQVKSRLPPSELKSATLKIAEDLLLGGRALEENSRKTVRTFLNELKRKHTPLCISDEERVMILKAMDLTKGHWFKCPNGHVYAIGECGGATEESTCPDCGANIGGLGHRLDSRNALASEMDGATHPSFGTVANNMNNFDLLNVPDDI